MSLPVACSALTEWLHGRFQPTARCCSVIRRYVQVIITAERAILPQNALGRPEHTEFVDKLLATVKEAHQARLRAEQEGDEASLDSGAHV